MKQCKICYVVTLSSTIHAFFVPQLEYLVKNGFHVTVICNDDANLSNSLKTKGIRLIHIDFPRGISVWSSITSILKLLHIYAKEKFDLVQYSTPNAAFYSSVASKITRIKVRNYHIMGFRYLGASGFGRTILKGIEKIACALSTSVECVSESNLNLGIHEGLFDKKKATIVWHGSTGGVDLKRFNHAKRSVWRNEVRAKWGVTDNDFVFGFVGRITKDKGIDEMLEAFMNLSSGTKLLIIGAEEGIDTLNQQLLHKARLCSDIIFQGEVSNVERYFAAIDVLLLPSYREGFGNVIIEAAAMGTPAIVSNIPGPIDAIDPGKTAFVVPVKNVSELGKAMERARGEVIHGMEKACVEFVRTHFDSEKLCEKIYQRKRALLDKA